MTIRDMISKRPVCFIDILGFRNMVNTMPLADIALKYEMLLQMAAFYMRPQPGYENLPSLFPGHPSTEPFCISHVFSDSFIFVSRDTDATSCLKLLVYTWRVTQAFLAVQVPVRGSITCDEIYINQDTGVFLGRGLTEAYTLEQKQNWVGVVIDSSVEKAYPALFRKPLDSMTDLLFPKYMVPLKAANSSWMRVVNWRFNLVAEHGTKSLFNDGGERAAVEKINNTLEFARWFVQKGKVYVAEQSELPVELRTRWVGHSEPPFRHGDDL